MSCCCVSARFETVLAHDPDYDLAADFVADLAAWSVTPIRDTSCCCHPLTDVPYLRPGPRRRPAGLTMKENFS